MKIEITSELTGKKFVGSNYDEVLKKVSADDANFKREQELKKAEADKAEKEKSNERSKQKKELADAVIRAENELDEAWEVLEEKNKEAAKIISDAKEQAANLLKPYEEAVNAANEKRWNAVRNYNAQFGAFGIKYTDEKALTEYKRISDCFNKVFNNFWSSLL